MKFVILFVMMAAVVGDLTFNNADYTRAFGHEVGQFTNAIRGSSKTLWGA